MTDPISSDKSIKLHDTVCDTLTALLQSPDVKAADVMAAIKFLDNNNISVDLEESEKVADLRAILPYDDEQVA